MTLIEVFVTISVQEGHRQGKARVRIWHGTPETLLGHIGCPAQAR